MKINEIFEEVRLELYHIKRNARKNEISCLDLETFKAQKSSKCIYGQMTGSCNSDRANELMPKKYIYNQMEENICNKIKEGFFFTGLEVYLLECGPEKHKEIFDFLTGKTNLITID